MFIKKHITKILIILFLIILVLLYVTYCWLKFKNLEMSTAIEKLNCEYNLMVQWLPPEEKYRLKLELLTDTSLEEKKQMLENYKKARLNERFILLVPGTSKVLFKKFFILVCLVKTGATKDPVIIDYIVRTLNTSVKYNQIFTENKDDFFLLIQPADLKKLFRENMELASSVGVHNNLAWERSKQGYFYDFLLENLIQEVKLKDPTLAASIALGESSPSGNTRSRYHWEYYYTPPKTQ